MPDDDAVLEALLRRVVREELARLPIVRTDARLEPFLQACHAYSLSSWWTCGELIADARRDRRRDLQQTIAAITGRADPARSLGRFLQRHEGAEVAGLRLEHAGACGVSFRRFQTVDMVSLPPPPATVKPARQEPAMRPNELPVA